MERMMHPARKIQVPEEVIPVSLVAPAVDAVGVELRGTKAILKEYREWRDENPNPSERAELIDQLAAELEALANASTGLVNSIIDGA
jgi:Cu/Ag efflux pump CusA